MGCENLVNGVCVINKVEHNGCIEHPTNCKFYKDDLLSENKEVVAKMLKELEGFSHTKKWEILKKIQKQLDLEAFL